MNLKILCLAILLSPFSSFARSCNAVEYDKAEYFSSKFGKKIANEYQGTRNVRTNMSSCSYNSYSGKFKTKVEVYWTGALSGDSYNIDGQLLFNSDGGGGEFSATYKNQNLKDWEFMIGFWGTVIVLGAASSSN